MSVIMFCLMIISVMPAVSVAQVNIPRTQHVDLDVDFHLVYDGDGQPPSSGAAATGRLATDIFFDEKGNAREAFMQWVFPLHFEADDTLLSMDIHEGDPSAPYDNNTIDAFFNFGCVNASPPWPRKVSSGETTLVGWILYSSRTDLDTLQRMVADPPAFFADIHSESAPDGILRGRLHRSVFQLTSANDADLRELRADVGALKSQLDLIQNWIQRIGVKVGIAIRPEDR